SSWVACHLPCASTWAASSVTAKVPPPVTESGSPLTKVPWPTSSRMSPLAVFLVISGPGGRLVPPVPISHCYMFVFSLAPLWVTASATLPVLRALVARPTSRILSGLIMSEPLTATFSGERLIGGWMPRSPRERDKDHPFPPCDPVLCLRVTCPTPA